VFLQPSRHAGRFITGMTTSWQSRSSGETHSLYFFALVLHHRRQNCHNRQAAHDHYYAKPAELSEFHFPCIIKIFDGGELGFHDLHVTHGRLLFGINVFVIVRTFVRPFVCTIMHDDVLVKENFDLRLCVQR
jgi:hypothetical protein